MNKPQTICIPDNIPPERVPEYRYAVHAQVAHGLHVEHAELQVWIILMHRAGILDRIPDCPFAAEARGIV